MNGAWLIIMGLAFVSFLCIVATVFQTIPFEPITYVFSYLIAALISTTIAFKLFETFNAFREVDIFLATIGFALISISLIATASILWDVSLFIITFILQIIGFTLLALSLRWKI